MQTGVSTTYLTESEPTMFHNFWTRKMLGEGETPADFMEVTAAQKAAFEKEAAEWKRPPQAFIDFWNAACVVVTPITGNRAAIGRYNGETGYFELNGITDITYEEALEIYALRLNFRPSALTSWLSNQTFRARTLFPIPINPEGAMAVNALFQNCASLEVASFVNGTSSNLREGKVQIANGNFMFAWCHNLREIKGVLGFGYKGTAMTNAFSECYKLEEVNFNFYYPNQSIDLRHSPLLSLRSMTYMTEHANAGCAATVTLHRSVYDKIMDESGEWHHLFAAAQAKSITIATP